MSNYLFVYGTLRKAAYGPMQRLIDDYCDVIGEATLQGRLYDLGNYPGLVESDSYSDIVVGECFQLKASEYVLAEFDAYEECNESFAKPWLYRREKRSCILNSGEELDVWVYIYNRSVEGKTHIQSGDYLGYLEHKLSRL